MSLLKICDAYASVSGIGEAIEKQIHANEVESSKSGVDMAKDNDKESFRCPFCPAALFEQPSDLILHLRDHNPNYVPNVSSAGKSVNESHRQNSDSMKGTCERNENYKKEHPSEIKNSTEEEAFSSNPETSSNQMSTTRNTKVASRKKQGCTFCGKAVQAGNDFEDHVRNHIGERSFECRLCSNSYFGKKGLTEHLRKTHGLDTSSKRFYWMESVPSSGFGMVHVNLLPVIKRSIFECDTCPSKFYRKSNLNRHLKIHTGKKKQECIFCLKVFESKSNLMSHIRFHTKERPYGCKTCSKTFVTSSDLNCHIRIHTGVKPYKCIHCFKRFKKASHLKRHTRSHNSEKPFECSICSAKFTRNDNLKTHSIRVHKIAF